MDEEINEIKRLFFMMLVDSRAEMREESAEKLLAHKDANINKLVEAARIIRKVIDQKAEPDELKKATSLFFELPNTKNWLSFVETSGQVVLQSALLMQERGVMEKGKVDTATDQGFAMLGLAFGPGFRLSKKTISLVEKIKNSNSKFAGNARMIVAWNRTLGGKPPDKNWPFNGGKPSGKNNAATPRRI